MENCGQIDVEDALILLAKTVVVCLIYNHFYNAADERYKNKLLQLSHSGWGGGTTPGNRRHAP